MIRLLQAGQPVLDEFGTVRTAAKLQLQRYCGTLPALLQPHLPRRWMHADIRFEPHPYVPLTAAFFGVSHADTVASAIAAGCLMEAHCCLQDARIDGHEELPPAASEALGNLFLAESLRRFDLLSGNAPALAPHVQQAFADLAVGYLEEESQDRDYFTAITNRCAPFHLLVAALGLHAGQPEQIAACSQMARHLLFWFQILDDMEDWPGDLANRRKTHLLHRLTPFAPPKPFAAWTPSDVEDALYLYGGAEDLLDEASRQLEAAYTIAQQGADALLPRWIDAVLEQQRQMRRWCIERKREFLLHAK